MRVTVIPEDKTVIVDSRALIFDFEAPDDLRALQWGGRTGHLELKSGAWVELSAEAYQKEVRPFVEAFEAEAARLDSCPGPFYDWDSAGRKWRLNPEAQRQARAAELEGEIRKLESLGERPNREINLALARGQEPPAAAVGKLEEIESRIAPLRAELQALSRDAGEDENA